MNPIISLHIEYAWVSSLKQLLPIPEVCSFPSILRIAGGGDAPALPANNKNNRIVIPTAILIVHHLIFLDISVLLAILDCPSDTDVLFNIQIKSNDSGIIEYEPAA
ncbi:MAG: hypothetical protein O8C59_06100 [Candidatus Methanoperedens sp.]|nr:hypothetical protein [Candidatus Methanoperedens sp.]